MLIAFQISDRSVFTKEKNMFTYSKKITRSIMIAVLVLTTLFSAASFVTQADARTKADPHDMHDAMRKLWEDHITWTRLVIVDALADPDAFLPSFETSRDRLLQNQVDIGNAVKPFYGEAAGDQLAALLTDHITIAAEILVAAKSGDDPALEDAIARWYDNADDIAVFLNTANPEHWPLEEMRAMMREHLDLTLQEAVAYLSGDYAGSANAYDSIHEQALEMADMLSEGIVLQFPRMFK
jgi:hypothetical protein